MENNPYNDEPGYDYSGEAQYYDELDKAEKQLEDKALREQEKYEEQLDRERREAANERGAKATSATYEIPSRPAADRSAAMKEALSYAEKEYGNEIRSPKYPEGNKQGYEGHGFSRNGMENTIDDQEPEYYLPHEAIEALDDIASGISRLKLALTADHPVQGPALETRLDTLQQGDTQNDVTERVSIDDSERPGNTASEDPETKE